MSEFDREYRDIRSMFDQKQHRDSLTTHVGYFVTDEEARSYEAWKSGRHHDTPMLILSGLLLIGTLVVSLAWLLV